MSELEGYLEFARQVCHEAGRLTLGHFSRSLEVIDKADGSPVTVADREAEALIRRAIEQRYPSHGIYGEEHGVKDPATGCSLTWFIDPIDGTKSFVRGVPLYGILLGLMREETNVVGVIQLPALGEQLAAASQLGSHLNGRRVRVSEIDRLDRAVVLTSDPREIAQSPPMPGWRQLWDGCRYPRSWGDAYGHYLVATGRAEIMLDPVVAPYDVGCLPVILREAGGSFFDWSGAETIFGGSGISCNAGLRPIVLESLGLSSSS